MGNHSYVDGTTMFLIVMCAGVLVVALSHCIGWMRSQMHRRGDDCSTQQLLDVIKTSKGKK